MADNNYSCLDLEKDFASSVGNPLDRRHCARIREQLLAEIQSLEERLADLQGDSVDFSLQQTCREMIHSRQQLYLQLRR